MNGIEFLLVWFAAAFVAFTTWLIVDTAFDNWAHARREAARHAADIAGDDL